MYYLLMIITAQCVICNNASYCLYKIWIWKVTNTSCETTLQCICLTQCSEVLKLLYCTVYEYMCAVSFHHWQQQTALCFCCIVSWKWSLLTPVCTLKPFHFPFLPDWVAAVTVKQKALRLRSPSAYYSVRGRLTALSANGETFVLYKTKEQRNTCV